MSGTNKETNEGKKRSATEAKIVEAAEVAPAAVVKESEVIEEAEIEIEAQEVKSGERKDDVPQTEQCKINLQNILTMLLNETETNDFWKKLSSLVDKLVESEYRTLAAFAFEKRESSGETLSTLFTKVLEAFESLLEQKQQTLNALTGDKSFEQERAINKIKDKITKQIIKINKHDKSTNSKFDSIKEGTYFLSLGNVWHATAKNLEDSFDKSCFNRKCDIIVRNENTTKNESNASSRSENDWYTRYQTTRNGAAVPTNKVAGGSARSKDSSGKSTHIFKVDIFGNEAVATTQSAHLMPYSKKCAATWFAVVPWVLNFSENNDKLTWSVRQKCIHGYIVNKVGENPEILNDDTEDTTQRKYKLVGIKHFPTNRIHLTSQGTYFDLYPCLLIVPILTTDEVNGWDGSGYSAIVLAAEYKTPESRQISAEEVYKIVGAGYGCSDGNFLATEPEMITARQLLESILRCLKATLKDFYQTDKLVEKANNAKYFKLEAMLTEFFDKVTECQDRSISGILREIKEMKFPVAVASTKFVTIANFVNVRKVAFSSRMSDAQNSTKVLLHPAPDPILLLLKSASNWLKQHNLPLLAGCMSQVVDVSDPISFEQECNIRGWNIVEKYPTEISCMDKLNSNDDDVSFTDESDF